MRKTLRRSALCFKSVASFKILWAVCTDVTSLRKGLGEGSFFLLIWAVAFVTSSAWILLLPADGPHFSTFLQEESPLDGGRDGEVRSALLLLSDTLSTS